MPCIEKIGDGTPGATVVYSFAQGAAALKAGKAIRYEGPGGPTSFDAYHDSTGIFQVDTYSAQGQVKSSRTVHEPTPCAWAVSATAQSPASTAVPLT